MYLVADSLAAASAELSPNSLTNTLPVKLLANPLAVSFAPSLAPIYIQMV